MGIRRAWQQLGHSGAPHARRFIISLSVVLAYLLSMLVLIGVPPSLFLNVTRSAGANVQDNLQLTMTGHWLMYCIFVFTFAWSIVVGGFAKTFLKPRHLGWPWLALFGLGLLLGLTLMFDPAREVVGAMRSGADNDNDMVIAFFTFWLLMVGYAAKAVWDEARDRMAAVFERHVNRDTAIPHE